jgi:hypothetical protein
VPSTDSSGGRRGQIPRGSRGGWEAPSQPGTCCCTPQASIEIAGLAGALDRGGRHDSLAVAANNAAANKVDFWLDQDLVHSVELLPDGAAASSTELRFRNDAPTVGEEYVLGPKFEGLEAGDNLMALSVFFPPGTELGSVEDGDGPVEHVVEQELGRVVATLGVQIAAGGEEAISFTGRAPDVWQADASGARGTYELVLQAQTAIRPLRAEVEVTVPEGMVVTDADEVFERVDPRTVRASLEPGPRTVLAVEFAEPLWSRASADLRSALTREVFRIGG